MGELREESATVTTTPAVSRSMTFKAGPQWKKFELETTSMQRSNGTTANQEGVIPANVTATPIPNYSRLVSMSGNLNAPAGTPK